MEDKDIRELNDQLEDLTNEVAEEMGTTALNDQLKEPTQDPPESEELEQLYQEYIQLKENIDGTNSSDSMLRDLWDLHKKILKIAGFRKLKSPPL